LHNPQGEGGNGGSGMQLYGERCIEKRGKVHGSTLMLKIFT
jgi:hypothetical protein